MKVHIDEFREDSEMSLMMRVWSQFVEHDLFNTATSAGINSWSKYFTIYKV
jgi:hypothetical protein